MPREDRIRIPVTILTGFLGSGKTTLLNRVLRDRRFADTAVIVNEIGAIGLDHLLIEHATDDVVLLDSGCLCCGLQGGLRETLADLFVRRAAGKIPRFARVIVETTGVADPGPIANTLVLDALLRAEFRLAAIVTTVDALHAVAQIAANPEALRQIALADVLVMTKMDLAAHAEINTLSERLLGLNSLASRVVSSGEIGLGLLFPDHRTAPLGTAFESTLWHSGRLAPVGARDRRFATFERRIEHTVHWSGIAAWTALVTARFGDSLLRVKGLFAVGDLGAPVAVHGVSGFFHPPERLTRWPSADHSSRLVCIGCDLDEARLEQSLAALMHEEGVAVTDAHYLI